MAEPDFTLPRGHLHCALFLLQRAYIKEGWLRWDSPEAKVVRELFLALRREDAPEGYGDEWYRREWERPHQALGYQSPVRFRRKRLLVA